MEVLELKERAEKQLVLQEQQEQQAEQAEQVLRVLEALAVHLV